MYRFDREQNKRDLFKIVRTRAQRPTDEVMGRCEMITFSGKIRGRGRQKDVNRNK